jgi:hypothetical protein
MLQAIKFSKGNLEILDQLQLPFVEEYIPIRTTEDDGQKFCKSWERREERTLSAAGTWDSLLNQCLWPRATLRSWISYNFPSSKNIFPFGLQKMDGTPSKI